MSCLIAVGRSFGRTCRGDEAASLLAVGIGGFGGNPTCSRGDAAEKRLGTIESIRALPMRQSCRHCQKEAMASRPYLEATAAQGNVEAALNLLVIALFGSASADRSATGIQTSIALLRSCSSTKRCDCFHARPSGASGLGRSQDLRRAAGLRSRAHLNGHANRAMSPARIGVVLHIAAGSL